MIFLYSDKASSEFLSLRGEEFKYLIKVRRHTIGDIVNFRNISNPDIMYSYKIVEISRSDVKFELISKKEHIIKPKHFLHVGWCVIDSKSVEKVLASLNEIGVSKISFIYCDRSQRNFKPDLKRYERILKSSNQQCGRSDFLEFEIYKNLDEFLDKYPDVKVFDFCDNYLKKEQKFSDVLVGCEGGFSKEEKELLSQKEVFSLDTPLVLRSESAVMAISSKILV